MHCLDEAFAQIELFMQDSYEAFTLIDLPTQEFQKVFRYIVREHFIV